LDIRLIKKPMAACAGHEALGFLGFPGAAVAIKGVVLAGALVAGLADELPGLGGVELYAE
jgi:hypothetical protein